MSQVVAYGGAKASSLRCDGMTVAEALNTVIRQYFTKEFGSNTRVYINGSDKEAPHTSILEDGDRLWIVKPDGDKNEKRIARVRRGSSSSTAISKRENPLAPIAMKLLGVKNEAKDFQKKLEAYARLVAYKPLNPFQQKVRALPDKYVFNLIKDWFLPPIANPNVDIKEPLAIIENANKEANYNIQDIMVSTSDLLQQQMLTLEGLVDDYETQIKDSDDIPFLLSKVSQYSKMDVDGKVDELLKIQQENMDQDQKKQWVAKLKDALKNNLVNEGHYLSFIQSTGEIATVLYTQNSINLMGLVGSAEKMNEVRLNLSDLNEYNMACATSSKVVMEIIENAVAQMVASQDVAKELADSCFSSKPNMDKIKQLTEKAKNASRATSNTFREYKPTAGRSSLNDSSKTNGKSKRSIKDLMETIETETTTPPQENVVEGTPTVKNTEGVYVPVEEQKQEVPGGN